MYHNRLLQHWKTACVNSTKWQTWGFHWLVFGRTNLSALVYSVCMRRAARTKSPSDLFTTTTSATSTMPFLIPTTCHNQCHSIYCLDKILISMPSKSCSLDPMPTWMAKKIQDVLVHVICSLCDTTLHCAIFPVGQKQSLKKSTLNPDHLTSYRTISNLSFISKVVEHIVASRFVQHAEDNH